MDTVLGVVFGIFGFLYEHIKGIFDDLNAHPWFWAVIATIYCTYTLEKVINRRFDHMQRQLDVLAERMTGRDTYAR
jgi:hypothetical protein